MTSMRSGWVPFVTLTIAGCSSAPVTDVRESTTAVPQYEAAAFFDTTSYAMAPASGLAFSPDGKSLLISSDTTGVFNAYELPLDGADPRPLTDSPDNAIFAVSWFPSDRRVIYTFDEGGNELNHVAVRELDGSRTDLTPGDDLKAAFLGWSGDMQSFYLLSNERDERHFDVYRYAVSDYARERVFENDGYNVSAISDDGRWLALDKARTSADSDIYLAELGGAGATPRLITAHHGNIEHTVLGFVPGSAQLVYGTNEHGEFSQAWTYDVDSARTRKLVAADWDVSYVNYSRSGRYRTVGVNADARTDVTISDTKTGRDLRLPSLPKGDLSNLRFSPDESKVALIVNASDAPSDIYLVELGGGARRLTDALNPAIDRDHLVAAQVVRYKSFDGLEIPAILYTPHGASAANPAPALVWVHGGPGGQSRTGYSATIQHLVNHGYAVMAANNRGSSGYGKTFYHLDDRRHGEEDLQDIVYGRQYLESLPWVDADRIGVIGGSYGGFMVAAALAFEPEVFDVGINIFGVTNWVRTLESIPPWWESFREALFDEMGDPKTDGERHRRISPLFHAHQIVRPLLVVQGANDPRVLQVESDELVEAVRRNGVTVEYVVFPDEGHGFRARANRVTASEAYVRFLDMHLRQ